MSLGLFLSVIFYLVVSHCCRINIFILKIRGKHLLGFWHLVFLGDSFSVTHFQSSWAGNSEVCVTSELTKTSLSLHTPCNLTWNASPALSAWQLPFASSRCLHSFYHSAPILLQAGPLPLWITSALKYMHHLVALLSPSCPLFPQRYIFYSNSMFYPTPRLLITA